MSFSVLGAEAEYVTRTDVFAVVEHIIGYRVFPRRDVNATPRTYERFFIYTGINLDTSCKNHNCQKEISQSSHQFKLFKILKLIR